MPVRPEYAHLYRTAEWKTIRKRILEREKDRCKHCGANNGSTVQRRVLRTREGLVMWWRYVSRSHPPKNLWRDAKGRRTVPPQAFTREWTAAVQLGIAHLDQNPKNNADENLAALCRRCHIVYDTAQHKTNSANTRKTRKDGSRPLLRLLHQEGGIRYDV